jgi:methyl-accepting chemotaxis protein
MKERDLFKGKISFQLLFITALLIVSVTTIVGMISYSIAKRELIESGKLDLQHIVENALTELRYLDKQVKEGKLTLEEAQEEARTMLIGPKTGGSEGNLLYDFKQASFTYKEDGYMYAFNSNYEVQMHPLQPFGADLSNLQDSKGNYVIKELVERSKSADKDSRYYDYFWKNQGETKEREKIAYVSYFEEWDWMVGVGAYTDEFYESLNTLKYIIMIVTAIISLVGLLGFYFITRRKVKVLERLEEASTVVAGGNLAVQPVRYQGKDEIGALTTAFNSMVSNLQMLVENIKEMSGKVSQSSTELSALSEETTASSEEIHRAIQEIARGNAAQAAEIETLSNQTEVLATSIESLSQQNRRILDLTKHATKAIDNGKVQVSALQEANQASVRSSDAISVGISNLYTKVKEISNIVTTIEQIASQTNLLALNASIEAARAGEHGKGFAVVAEEVRKLAEATNQSTAEIQQMIEGIEKETETTVTIMSKTVDISKTLNQAVHDTEHEFSAISSAISNIVEAIQASSQEIQRIQENMKNFLDATSTISAVAEQTSASSQEIMASVDGQVNAINAIANSALQLNELSEQLNRLIGKFQVKE